MRNAIRSLLALTVAISVLAVPFLVIRVGYNIAYFGAAVEIEQLRSDLARLSDAVPGEVVGQATQWNQTIRRMQEYNGQWWGDPFLPDEWGKVTMLAIPEHGKNSPKVQPDAEPREPGNTEPHVLEGPSSAPTRKTPVEL